MQFLFTAHQIARLAIEAEEAGEKFYRDLARQLIDPKIKDILLFFADQEKDHIQQFSQILAETQNSHIEQQFSIDVVRMMKEGIKSLRTKGFSKAPVNAKSINVNQCLELAAQVENESIRVYQEILNAFAGAYHTLLTKIINEEKAHLKMLQDVRQASSALK